MEGKEIEKEPMYIWVNIYNPIKTNSWDIHKSEESAVKNSIGAETHQYIHESKYATLQANLEKAKELIEIYVGQNRIAQEGFVPVIDNETYSKSVYFLTALEAK